ncbi:MAG: hypothetical protein CMF48_03355 [Legionellales bacterium]|nr:hypothetical protein [Legionellales bacterium]|tara:strand:- start:58 stop:636 length:579 start_codon:yes stop_codon:yes gene_type:complete
MIEILPNWHPVLVHFTVALYFTAGMLLLLAKAFNGQHWTESVTKAAHINLWVGGLITFLTLGAGFHAYMTVPHDAVSHQAMTDHRNWAWMTAPLLFFVSGWSALKCCKAKQFNPLFYLILLVGLFMLGVTAFKGGELVYRYGLGVQTTQFANKNEQHKASGDIQMQQANEPGQVLQPENPKPSAHDHGTHAH